MDLQKILSTPECSLYIKKTQKSSLVTTIIASTPGTRIIANDPCITGVKYTSLLKKSCTSVLRNLASNKILFIKEKETLVLNILRGGLNFGLREALADAFSWNLHGSAFISAQRARYTQNQEEWHITESDYKKVYVPKKVSIIFGDVVATGTSLKYALNEILNAVEKQQSTLTSLLFFTYGGLSAEEILTEIDSECRKRFPNFNSSVLVYLEGVFDVASTETLVSIKESGTDLLRRHALLAPEFIESQYENPSYPLERCAIYDAGSRAFWQPDYAKDIYEYWLATMKLAENGMTFKELLTERFPLLDFSSFDNPSLKNISKKQINKIEKT
ncbi:MAG: hypothetical protein U9O87_09290, partial [Verrucomicrobiota bacterium]|nr:hypothetical protein [Verrucomicrobiota bacterium]